MLFKLSRKINIKRSFRCTSIIQQCKSDKSYNLTMILLYNANNEGIRFNFIFTLKKIMKQSRKQANYVYIAIN